MLAELDQITSILSNVCHRGCFPYKARTFNRAQICTNFKNI